MKKTYETPKAEKLVFDYTESVVACTSEELQDAEHDLGNNNYKCSCTPYYAPGWGKNC